MAISPEIRTAELIKNKVIDDSFNLNPELNLLELPKLTSIQLKCLENILKTKLNVNDEEGRHLFTVEIAELLKLLKKLILTIPNIKLEGFYLVGGGVSKVMESDPSYFEKLIAYWDPSCQITILFPQRAIPDIDIRIHILGEKREEIGKKFVALLASLAQAQEPVLMAAKIATLFYKQNFVPEHNQSELENRIRTYWIHPNCGSLSKYEMECIDALSSKILLKQSIFTKFGPDINDAPKRNYFFVINLCGLELVLYEEMGRGHLTSLDAVRLELKNGFIYPEPKHIQTAQGLFDRAFDLDRIDQPEEVNEYDFLKLKTNAAQGKNLALIKDEALALPKFIDALKTKVGQIEFQKYINNHYQNDSASLFCFLWECYSAFWLLSSAEDQKLFLDFIQPYLVQLKESKIHLLLKVALRCMVENTSSFEDFSRVICALHALTETHTLKTLDGIKLSQRKDIKTSRVMLIIDSNVKEGVPYVIQMMTLPHAESTGDTRKLLMELLPQIVVQDCNGRPIEKPELWLCHDSYNPIKQERIRLLLKERQFLLALEWFQRWWNLTKVENGPFIFEVLNALLDFNASDLNRVWILANVLKILKTTPTLSPFNQHVLTQKGLVKSIELVKESSPSNSSNLLIEWLERTLTIRTLQPDSALDTVINIISALQLVQTRRLIVSDNFLTTIAKDLPSILKHLKNHQKFNEAVDLVEACLFLKIPVLLISEALHYILWAYVQTRQLSCSLKLSSILAALAKSSSKMPFEMRGPYLNDLLPVLDTLHKRDNREAEKQLTNLLLSVPELVGEINKKHFQYFVEKLEGNFKEKARTLLRDSHCSSIKSSLDTLSADQWTKLWKEYEGDTDPSSLSDLWNDWIKNGINTANSIQTLLLILKIIRPIHTTVVRDLIFKIKDFLSLPTCDQRHELLQEVLSIILKFDHLDIKELQEVESLYSELEISLPHPPYTHQWINLSEQWSEHCIRAGGRNLYMSVLNKLQTLWGPSIRNIHLAEHALLGILQYNITSQDEELSKCVREFYEYVLKSPQNKEIGNTVGLGWGLSSDIKLIREASKIIMKDKDYLHSSHSKSLKRLISHWFIFYSNLKEEIFVFLSIKNISETLGSEIYKDYCLRWVVEACKDIETIPDNLIRAKCLLKLFEKIKIFPKEALTDSLFQNRIIDIMMELLAKGDGYGMIDVIHAEYIGLLFKVFESKTEILVIDSIMFYQIAVGIPREHCLTPLSLIMTKDLYNTKLAHYISLHEILFLQRLMKVYSKQYPPIVKAFLLDVIYNSLRGVMAFTGHDILKYESKLHDLFKSYIKIVSPDDDKLLFEQHVEHALRIMLVGGINMKLFQRNIPLLYEGVIWLGHSIDLEKLIDSKFKMPLQARGEILKKILAELTAPNACQESLVHAVAVFAGAGENILRYDLKLHIECLKMVMPIVEKYPFLERKGKHLFLVFNNFVGKEIAEQGKNSANNPLEFFKLIFDSLIYIAEKNPTITFQNKHLLLVAFSWLRWARGSFFQKYNHDYMQHVIRLIPLALLEVFKDWENCKVWIDEICELIGSERLVKSNSEKLERAKLLNVLLEHVVRVPHMYALQLAKTIYIRAFTQGIYQDECFELSNSAKLLGLVD